MATNHSQRANVLWAATKRAVLASIRSVRGAHPAERLCGYALLTDDNLRTIGYAACTEEQVASCGVRNARFEPVEWTYCEGAEAFDEVRELLVASADAAKGPEEQATHVGEAFGTLVEALRQARLEGALGEDVFLTVISTDPNERLLGLEAAAVEALNSKQLFVRWRDGVVR